MNFKVKKTASKQYFAYFLKQNYYLEIPYMVYPRLYFEICWLYFKRQPVFKKREQTSKVFFAHFITWCIFLDSTMDITYSGKAVTRTNGVHTAGRKSSREGTDIRFSENSGVL